MKKKIFLALVSAAFLGATSVAAAATVYVGCPRTSENGFSVTVYLPGGPAYFFYNQGDHSTFTLEPGGVYRIELGLQDGSTVFVENISAIATEDVQLTYDGNTSDPRVLKPGQRFAEDITNSGGPLVISRHADDLPSQADRDKAAELKNLAEATYQKMEAGKD